TSHETFRARRRCGGVRDRGHPRLGLAVHPAREGRPVGRRQLHGVRGLSLRGRAQARHHHRERRRGGGPRHGHPPEPLPGPGEDLERRQGDPGFHRLRQDEGAHRREVRADQPGRLREDHPAQRQDLRGGAARRSRGVAFQVRLRQGVGTTHMSGGSPMIGCNSRRPKLGWGFTLTAFVLLSTVSPGWAGQAQDQLRGAIDRVVSTLENPALKGEGKSLERRHAVRKIADEIFDFNEIARRSLGRYWQPLTEPQRTEFVGLFADLLERSYISKIELYGGEKIIYSGERAEGDLATVSTKIITKNGTEVPVDYRLFKKSDRWM